MARKKTKLQKKVSREKRSQQPAAARVISPADQPDLQVSASAAFAKPVAIGKSPKALQSTKVASSEPSLKQQSMDILGYDYHLILTDLRVTVVVTVVLVLALILMSWYLPFGLSW